MPSHPRGRPHTFRVTLRPEARAAAVMLNSVQRKGEDSPYKQGLPFWIGDIVDTVVCVHFKETFGISVKEFLNRVRVRVPESRRAKYVPKDSSLQRSADALLARQYSLAGSSGEESAGDEAR